MTCDTPVSVDEDLDESHEGGGLAVLSFRSLAPEVSMMKGEGGVSEWCDG